MKAAHHKVWVNLQFVYVSHIGLQLFQENYTNGNGLHPRWLTG